MSLWPKVREELNIIVNQHFETPEYHQLFSLKLTPARQKVWDAHYPHYIKSRRDTNLSGTKWTHRSEWS
jgi:hypothetical protein